MYVENFDSFEELLQALEEASAAREADFERRRVSVTDTVHGFVSTMELPDDPGVFATGVADNRYWDGFVIVAERYTTREEAAEGHEKWVAAITSEHPPTEITDTEPPQKTYTLYGPDAEMKANTALN